MKLGKRFSRYQKKISGKASVTFTSEDGTVIRPRCKLNMMLALSIRGGINKKVFEKEEKHSANLNYYHYICIHKTAATVLN